MSHPLTYDEASSLARVLRALADPIRLRILSLIATADEPTTIAAITPVVGRAQQTVSYHVQALTAVGLVRRAPKYHLLTLDADAFAALASRLGGVKW